MTSATALAAQVESASFSVRGSNGFTVDVSDQGGRVTVIASERQPPVATFTPAGRLRSPGAGNGASSAYTAPAAGPTTPGAVGADFGPLGRIDVRFRPSGERTVTTLRRACGGPVRVVRRLGTFVGSISFRGEQGYTTVATTSAKGSVGTPPPACRSVAYAGRAYPPALASTGSRAAPAGAVLTAVDGSVGSSFRAATVPGGVSFQAQVEERAADGVTVVRHAAAGAPLASFTFDRSLTWAALRPPAPFSGRARFSVSGEPGWTGSLRVTFPGLSVALTGADFRSRLGRP